MSPVLLLAGVSTTAFVSTNVDAFLLLVAAGARAPRSRNAAAAGFVAATVVSLAAAWVLAAASAIIPPARAGLVGLIPLAMGLRQLALLVRRRAPATGEETSPSARPSSDAIHFGEALVLHLSMSADNLVVYAALLSDTLAHLRPLVAATILALTVIWAALARAALRVPGLSPVLLRWGHTLMAVMLIAVGAYILVDTETDVLPPRPGHGAVERASPARPPT